VPLSPRRRPGRDERTHHALHDDGRVLAGYERGTDGAVYAEAYQADAGTARRRAEECDKATLGYRQRTDRFGLDRFATGYVAGWDDYMESAT
jgi:hypothetical protein